MVLEQAINPMAIPLAGQSYGQTAGIYGPQFQGLQGLLGSPLSQIGHLLPYLTGQQFLPPGPIGQILSQFGQQSPWAAGQQFGSNVPFQFGQLPQHQLGQLLPQLLTQQLALQGQLGSIFGQPGNWLPFVTGQQFTPHGLGHIFGQASPYLPFGAGLRPF